MLYLQLKKYFLIMFLIWQISLIIRLKGIGVIVLILKISIGIRKKERKNLEENSCLFYIDFLENYVCKFSNEI